MIAFGCPILREEIYARYARTSIDAVREPNSLVLEKRGYGSIQEPYNEILDEASTHDALEAVVLMHEDTVIRERGLVQLIRGHLADPTVGVIGAIGASNVTSLDWWNATLLGRTAAPRVHPTDTPRYTEGVQEADVVDGYLMIVSAGAAQRVRFDERGKDLFHGYDVDFCFRVRALRMRVLVDDIDAQHWSVGMPNDPRWPRAAAEWRRTWDPSRWPREWQGSAPYGFFR
jgi:hypothetical protein